MATTANTHPARMGAQKSPWWSDLPREHGYEPLRVEGDVPASLRGTLYRTGPGLTQRFGAPYGHVFEGDGALSANRFADGRVDGAVKILRSDGYLAEEQAGRALFQTAVSKPHQIANNLRGRAKNTGNTNIMRWHDTLYALMENAKPTAFDSELETIGESTLGGVVGGTFSAHPHDVVARRATYNFGFSYGRKTMLSVYELPWEGAARELTTLPLDHPVMLHDFMATKNHLIFLVAPYRLVLHRAILSIGSFKDLFRWQPEFGTEVIVVPIDEPARTRRFKVDPFFQIHLAGGFEDAEAIYVDVMTYPDAGSLERNVSEIDRPPEAGELIRMTIPHDADRIDKERIAETRIEFGSVAPSVRGARHSQVYGVTVDETRFGAARIDIERGKEHCYWFPADEWIGEPVFVPASADAREDEGHVLTLVYASKTHTTHLAILDAQHLEDGPVARAHFDHHIPAGFHGVWVPEA
jgi:all-trans-8'-apo-beta-carotenal 15,15'-oxygenase